MCYCIFLSVYTEPSLNKTTSSIGILIFLAAFYSFSASYSYYLNILIDSDILSSSYINSGSSFKSPSISIFSIRSNSYAFYVCTSIFFLNASANFAFNSSYLASAYCYFTLIDGHNDLIDCYITDYGSDKQILYLNEY